MPDTQPTQSPAKAIRLIHLALIMGLVLVTAVMVTVKSTGQLAVAEPMPYQWLVITVVGVMSTALALVIFRPKYPNRGSTESVDAYWDARRRTGALVVWAQLEGAGLLGIVGYATTGMWAPLALAPIAILLLFFTRPATFEG